MIRQSLRHLPGVGPKRLQLLHQEGIRTWQDVLACPRTCSPIGGLDWGRVVDEVHRCEEAYARGDVRYLLKKLDPADRWRVLASFFDLLSYFDIETTGVEINAQVTLVGCWHEGRLQTFVKDENLEEFLGALEGVRILVSFNGAGFDVPHIKRHFNIPELPCTHIDLRSVCCKQGVNGTLKQVERELGLIRPPDLDGVTGEDAVRLWQKWISSGSAAARAQLIRYCNADVLALRGVTSRLLLRNGVQVEPIADPFKDLPPGPIRPTGRVPASLLPVEPARSSVGASRNCSTLSAREMPEPARTQSTGCLAIVAMMVGAFAGLFFLFGTRPL